jgi:FkbM family methyltransferase
MASHAAPSLSGAVSTRLLSLLVRGLPSERLRALRGGAIGRILDASLLRGRLQVRGGIVPRLRLDARHFDYSSAIAYGVLNGSYEPMVQEALRRTVAPGAVVLDVGASMGIMSLIAARLAGPNGQVIAIEPHSRSREAIEAHAAANGMRNIRVLRAAVGARSGEMEMVVTADPLWTITAAVGDHPLRESRERVRLVTLDELVATAEIPPPDVIKLDVEGSEVEVLEGMPKLISQRRPAVIAEMHDHNVDFCRVMNGYGYSVTNLDGPEPVDSAGPNIHVLCLSRD